MTKKPGNMDDQDFSLGLGGPLYQLYLSTRLAKEPLLLFKRRMFVICAIAWLPLLILSMVGGAAFSGVSLPFIYDISAHARFLPALALLILAEVVVHKRIHVIVQQFLKRDIIADEDKPRFYKIVQSAMRVRNSIAIEIFLLVFVFTAGHWISLEYGSLVVSSWFATRTSELFYFTPAGYWYTLVSVPLFQFILVRWYFRIGIWYHFMWRVSKLPLQLNSLHPDRAGGLGFLQNSIFAFLPFLLAHTVLLSGLILNRIVNVGESLPGFKTEIVFIVLFVTILPLAPLSFFMSSLVRVKRYGTIAYGEVANAYVNAFRDKWIDSSAGHSKAILGTSDIQSLADLFNSFQVTSTMRAFPFSRQTVIAVVILTALPLFPLILTMIPIEEIFLRAIKIIL